MEQRKVVSQRFAQEAYDEMLDECHPEVRIGQLRYAPSHALKLVDPVAYRCDVLDYADAMEWDIE